MKFGKTFPNHQVPEWAHKYVNYKGLKKQIKEITLVQDALFRQEQGAASQDGPARRRGRESKEQYLGHPEVKKLLAAFFFALDRDIEKVDGFYNMQFMEYDRRLRKLLSSAQLADITSVQRGATGYLHAPLPQYIAYGERERDGLPERYVPPHATDMSEDLAEVLTILLELRSHFRNLKWYGELNKRAFTKIMKKLDKKVGTNQQHSYFQARIKPLEFADDTPIVKALATINEILDRISPCVKDLQDKLRGEDRRLLQGSSSPIDVASQLVTKDDGAGLINELISMYRSVVLIPTRTLVTLLNKSALSRSFSCVDEILGIIPTLGDPSDINGRNFFHHHVIALGKKRTKSLEERDNINSLLSDSLDLEAAIPPEPNTRLVGAFGPDGVNSDDSPAPLSHILQQLPAHLRPSLLQRDNYKRTPLHYSAQYGLCEVTRIILQALSEWDAWNADVAIDDIDVWGDSENLTPLHLAVIGTHPLTVSTLLSFMNPEKSLNSPRLLHLATRLNSPSLLNSLLSAKGFDIDYQEPENLETALYVACKLDIYEAAEYLVKQGANMELGEKLFGWTPIFAAATEGYARIVQLLVDHGAKYDLFDESGWTPMEHAALRGHLDISQLIRITDNKAITRPKFATDWNKSTRPTETTNGLLSALTPSESGSTTTGSENKSSSLTPSTSNEMYALPARSSTSIDKISEPNKGNHRKVLKSQLSHGKVQTIKDTQLPQQPIKSFGHSFLQKDESVILLTLGTNDNRSTIPAVSLNKVPVAKASSTELDTALSLLVTCMDNLDAEPVMLDLPLHENLDSVTFKVPYKKDSSYTIFFDIVPTYGYSMANMNRENSSGMHSNVGNSTGPAYLDAQVGQCGSRLHYDQLGRDTPNTYDQRSRHQASQQKEQIATKKQSKILGRAVALLDSAPTSVGPNRRSIAEAITIPIIGSDTLEVLGIIRFDFLVVTPFVHKNLSVGPAETYWKSLVSTRVIGHRGLGKNMNTNKSLQLGENTVESFIAAASLGASYVEFDVQLTKDNIPVVYHDFLVAESGVDIPMHELTLEQFLDLNGERQRHQDAREAHRNHRSPNGRRLSMDDSSAELIKRSLMMRGDEDRTARDLNTIYGDRMRLTRTFKKNAFKANSRGHAIASSFVTLKELFKKIPQNVGFNIECKYPMVDEAEEEDIGPIAVEMNHWIDTVLEVVYDNVEGRDVIFSSFQPDVCLMLSLKQPSFPILFLTEGGTAKRCDIRAASLQNAIRFAHRWNLLGIVSAAAPIVIAPRLAQIVKSSGLVCVTYGVENNDPEIARVEMDAGVDAVIVDSVLAVRKGLTREAQDADTL
ncbi:AGR223Wp [Eremothecium gossypii ATCC 10895]|uniref:Glycerophosphocholine phosphodiesterase GDE1 n=1 Tax=Eremothecium gossypii (strain ATCC 10895 / CBS 109.51 / FGSC 9923 / NRRL Y-1056) TaxID=284811 RepID=GDE1_EREGS|nr:AGR223Wp [Eremothecium gossypii ATCC 10895]Q74ZH9.2 RecName: Full=Glycerophosphocholine phosphodiesterase GDE1; AltName: Full=Glycerophosphodiester phosphodiesterase GDE1 [Eremothecium gossypii ATCC 10895]AAS54713.2 AGR223Wp [Eremothecium gossypii ATCC 10895]AEY99043.1 FAGR223Wp [Eremothecium gossypii FDAG1]